MPHQGLEHLERLLVSELPEIAGLGLAEALQQANHEPGVEVGQGRLGNGRLILARLAAMATSSPAAR